MMRKSEAVEEQIGLPLPRGWIVLGSVVVSWLLLALLWAGTSQVFTMISHAG